MLTINFRFLKQLDCQNFQQSEESFSRRIKKFYATMDDHKWQLKKEISLIYNELKYLYERKTAQKSRQHLF
jgi:hypothetical protein